jgi:hypothetical protein
MSGMNKLAAPTAKVTQAHKKINARQIEFHLKKSLLCSVQAQQVMQLLDVPVLYIGEGETVQQAMEKNRDFCLENGSASAHSKRR